MDYIKAFLVGGAFCLIGQILIDKTKLTPARILVSYVVIGVFLGAVGVYEPLAEFAGAGATVPLTGFGYNLAKGVKEAILLHRFFDTLGQIIAETSQWNGCAGPGKFNQWLVNTDSAKKYTDNHIADENSGGCQLGFINQNLADQTQRATNKKCFDIIHLSPSL